MDAPTPIDEVDPGASRGSADDEAAPDEPHARDPLLDAPVARQPAKATRAGDPHHLPATAPPTPGEAPAQGAVAAPPIVVPAATTAQLEALFAEWQKATAELNRAGAEQKQKALFAAKTELSASQLEPLGMATARAAQQRLEANDPVGAVELGNAAVELAPGLPWAHFALARIYMGSDLAEVGRWLEELEATFALLWSDPRYLRPALGDLAFAVLAALLATAVTAVGLLFLRRARYFLHDFHHLFPRTAARWQTVSLAVLLLALPWAFRLGAIPMLLAAFAAVTLYLEWKERFVAAALIALVGLVPFAGKLVTQGTLFSGTVAEQLYLLDRGGTEADGASIAVRARMEKGTATFPELLALGRYELHRGHLDDADQSFKKAALENGTDARVMVNLGNIRFARGDLEGAFTLYTRATEADPNLAAAFFNLSKLHSRRAELEKAQTARETAEQLDPTLRSRLEPAKEQPQALNQLLLSPGLRWDEMKPLAVLPEAGEHVADQLESRLLGMGASPLAYLLPALIALGLVGLGVLQRRLATSRVCNKCGRPVCRRCDPELGSGSALCGQCVNVFARRGLVAPQVMVHKQLEVDRFQTRTERLSWILGLVCSGGGHLYRGFPLRGALFAFSFLFLVFVGVYREGVLRAPYGELPTALRLVPAGLVLVFVYFLSLRSLGKAQTR